ncbi:SRPBCC family protein [Halocatena marina]|uniref:SRPBCC family protein n=1 Tax=Halocatena marina TaxID=2934937 RepID=A0ABD5YS61_9EURY|nr:SRPBCC family protein [Halocatena marina]
MTDNAIDETRTNVTDTTLTLRRTFDAPRERVWRAFTDPDELEQWFVPEGMSAEVHSHELKPGGSMSIVWTDGEHRIDNEGYYIEVVENERLVSGEETEVGELRLTYEFREVEDGTEVIITQEFPEEIPDGAADGWAGILENLAEIVEGAVAEHTQTEEQSVTVNRVIEAPPERVYNAFVDPDELAVWLPPEGFSCEVHEFDASEGGTFRMSFTADSEELEPYARTFHRTYEELTPNERIVYTESFESDDLGMAGEMTTTVTFEDDPDGTDLTVRQTGIPEKISPENAEEGWTDSLGNLAKLAEDA